MFGPRKSKVVQELSHLGLQEDGSWDAALTLFTALGIKKQTFNITLGTYMQIIFSNDMFVIKSFWRNELKSVLWVWLGHLLHSRNWQNTVNYILIKNFLNVLWNFRILSSFTTPVTFALFQFILVPWFSLGGWRGWMGNGLTLTSTTSCKIRKSTGLGVRRPW